MTKVDDLIGYARGQLGEPYIFGDEGPDSFDCSGLMQYCYGLVGLKLPRVARDQQDFVTPIAASARQPGDLIFWGDPAHHVALYVGDGKMISAPGRGKSVHLVNVNGNVTYGRVPGLGAGVAGPVGAVESTVGLAGDWVADAKDWLVEGGFVILGLALVVAGAWQAVGARQLQNAQTKLGELL